MRITKMSEYSNNDYRDYLEHSWGKKPEQKAAEKAYNAKYYLENKARILAQRAKSAAGITQKAELESAKSDLQSAKMDHDYLQRSIDQTSKEYDEALRSGASDAKRKALVDQRMSQQKRQNDWDRFTRYNDKSLAYSRAKEAYSKTPLGKAESAVSAGKNAISNLLKKLKRG